MGYSKLNRLPFTKQAKQIGRLLETSIHYKYLKLCHQLTCEQNWQIISHMLICTIAMSKVKSTYDIKININLKLG